MLDHFFVYDYKETHTNIAWIKIGKIFWGTVLVFIINLEIIEYNLSINHWLI